MLVAAAAKKKKKVGAAKPTTPKPATPSKPKPATPATTRVPSSFSPWIRDSRLDVPLEVLDLTALGEADKRRVIDVLKRHVARGDIRFPDVFVPSRDQVRDALKRLFASKSEGVIDVAAKRIKPVGVYNCVSAEFQARERLDTPLARGRTRTVKDLFARVDAWVPRVFARPDPKLCTRPLQRALLEYNSAAYQFPVATARAVYVHYGAKRVFDPCFGWGDRFAAAVAAPCVDLYTGVDPRPGAAAGFRRQAARYKGILPQRRAMIEASSCHTALAQDFKPAAAAAKYDFVFTCPPYFCYRIGAMTEMYRGTDSSMETSEAYMTTTLLPICRAGWAAASKGGRVAIVVKLRDPDERRLLAEMRALGAAHETTYTVNWSENGALPERVFVWRKK